MTELSTVKLIMFTKGHYALCTKTAKMILVLFDGSICHTIENNQMPFLFSKNELDIGTVIDATVGSAYRISQEWGF